MSSAPSHLLVCPLVIGLLCTGSMFAAEKSGRPEKKIRFNIQNSINFYDTLSKIKTIIEPYRASTEKLRVIHLDIFSGTSALSLHEHKEGGQGRFEIEHLAVYHSYPLEQGRSHHAEIVRKTVSISQDDGDRLLKHCENVADQIDTLSPADHSRAATSFHVEMKGSDELSPARKISFIVTSETSQRLNFSNAILTLGNYVVFGEEFGSLAEFRKIPIN